MTKVPTVDGILIREKDREWLERLPKMEDDVRIKFLHYLQKVMILIAALGIIVGINLTVFFYSVMA